MKLSGGTFKSLLVLSSMLVLFAVAAGYSGSEDWAVPKQRPPGQTVPTPGTGQSVTSVSPTAAFSADLGGGFSISGPVGSVDTPINFVFTPQPTGTLPPAQSGFKLLGHAFTLEAYAGVTLLPGYVFHTPVTLCFTYTDADVAAAGGNAANLVFQFFNAATGMWEDLPTTVNSTTHQVCATVSHLSVFSLNAHVPAGLPSTGDAVISISTVGIVLGVAIVLILIGWALRSKRKALR